MHNRETPIDYDEAEGVLDDCGDPVDPVDYDDDGLPIDYDQLDDSERYTPRWDW